MAMDFMEDAQFKDFVSAASYHAPELIETVAVPCLIQRLFAVKPEALDFMDYEVVFAELDSSGLRARVKMRVKAKLLLNEPIEERGLILYSYRDSPAVVHEAGGKPVPAYPGSGPRPRVRSSTSNSAATGCTPLRCEVPPIRPVIPVAEPDGPTPSSATPASQPVLRHRSWIPVRDGQVIGHRFRRYNS